MEESSRNYPTVVGILLSISLANVLLGGPSPAFNQHTGTEDTCTVLSPVSPRAYANHRGDDICSPAFRTHRVGATPVLANVPLVTTLSCDDLVVVPLLLAYPKWQEVFLQWTGSHWEL